METPKPSRRIVLQRIRNRIIEYFEIASSYEEQCDFQSKVPHIHVPNEIINQWEDYVSKDWRPDYIEPVFSPDEQVAIDTFGAAWETVADATPNPLPPLEQLIGNVYWEQLRSAASNALAVFLKRGKLPEDSEIA
jgi:hypothetical protein